MCFDCVIDTEVDRGNIVCEDGAYFINLKPCAACSKRGMPKNVKRVETEKENGSETVVYEHVCQFCGHVIAVHHYEMKVDERHGLQVYSMSCELCGTSEDERRIDPDDPVGMPLF